MKITSQTMLEELERLAASLPWDRVEISVQRDPEAVYRFQSYVPSNDKFGFEYIFGHGNTPAEAVDNILEQAKNQGRDPEIARNKKIREFEEKIDKLKAVNIGLPPYKPNRELTNGNGEASITQSPRTVDV